MLFSPSIDKKPIFSWQWRVGGSWKHFCIPCDTWGILPFLKKGPQTVRCTGKKERWLCLEGKGSTGVRNTGVRGRGVRNKSKPTKNTVTLPGFGAHITTPKLSPGVVLPLPASRIPSQELLHPPALLLHAVLPGIKVFPSAGDTPAWGQCVLSQWFPCAHWPCSLLSLLYTVGIDTFCHHHCPCAPRAAGDNQAEHGVGILLTQLFGNLWFALLEISYLIKTPCFSSWRNFFFS